MSFGLLRVLLASTLLVLVAMGSSQARNEERDDVELTDVRKHTKEFMGYFQTIKLTPQVRWPMSATTLATQRLAISSSNMGLSLRLTENDKLSGPRS